MYYTESTAAHNLKLIKTQILNNKGLNKFSAFKTFSNARTALITSARDIKFNISTLKCLNNNPNPSTDDSSETEKT